MWRDFFCHKGGGTLKETHGSKCMATLRTKRLFISAALLAVSACHTDADSLLVYSSGFSFSRYEYVIVAKPDGQTTGAALYGMDVELANLLTRYNMKVLGSREYEALSTDDKGKTLFARMSLSAGKEQLVVTVSFDDMVTGRTGASVTTYAKGDIFDTDSRNEAFGDAAKSLINALQHDKDLKISDNQNPSEKKKRPQSLTSTGVNLQGSQGEPPR